MIELFAINKKQQTQNKKRNSSKITTNGMISWFHPFFEVNKGYNTTQQDNSRDIGQKTQHKLSKIAIREKQREKCHQDKYKDQGNHIYTTTK